MECRDFNPDLTVITEKTKVKLYKKSEQDKLIDDRRIKLRGQKKLLLIETRFLTDWLTEDMQNIILIFVGAVTGEHYLLLEEMFPYIKQFHLWDPEINPESDVTLDPKVREKSKQPNSKFILFPQILDSQKAKIEYTHEKYKNEILILISDIRSKDYLANDDEKNQKIIIKDNETQKELVEIINPVFALLKMKFPFPDIYKKMYNTINYEYLDGIIYTQTMNNIKSFEMRLVVGRGIGTTYETKIYNLETMNDKFTNNMMDTRRYWISKHNNIKNEWKNSVNGFCEYPENMDLRSDFDSAYVIYILQRYIKKHTKGIKSNIPNTMFAEALALWKYITVNLKK